MSLLLTWAQMTGAHHTERHKNKMIWEADILWCNYQMTILVFRPHVAHFLMSRVKWVKAIWLKQQKMSLQHVCFVGKWMIDCSSAHTHCNAESHKEVYSLSEARLLKIHPQPNTYYWCSVQICVTAFLAKVYTDRKKILSLNSEGVCATSQQMQGEDGDGDSAGTWPTFLRISVMAYFPDDKRTRRATHGGDDCELWELSRLVRNNEPRSIIESERKLGTMHCRELLSGYDTVLINTDVSV